MQLYIFPMLAASRQSVYIFKAHDRSRRDISINAHAFVPSRIHTLSVFYARFGYREFTPGVTSNSSMGEGRGGSTSLNPGVCFMN